MRLVLFKTWIPVEWENHPSGGVKTKVEGTGKWTDEFQEGGIFQAWGMAYEEFDAGPANYTVALVEMPDGTVTEVLPSNLKFTT